jgi:carboxylesterase
MARQPLGALIVHGFTSSLDCVSPMQSPIEALGLPVRVPVLRGHGAESPDALHGVVWQDWVDDAEAALQDLLAEVKCLIIIGHSMGALVALTLAANHAGEDALDSIVVVAPAVQLTSPVAPGRPFSFLRPILTLVKRRHNMPPVRADKSLEKHDTNYPWAPMSAVKELLVFSSRARERLSEIDVPTLIVQSHNDSTVAPESAEIVYAGIATPADDKRIVWFEETEHEMFRDCEREAVVEVIVDYVRKRVSAREVA